MADLGNCLTNDAHPLSRCHASGQTLSTQDKSCRLSYKSIVPIYIELNFKPQRHGDIHFLPLIIRPRSARRNADCGISLSVLCYLRAYYLSTLCLCGLSFYSVYCLLCFVWILNECCFGATALGKFKQVVLARSFFRNFVGKIKNPLLTTLLYIWIKTMIS